MPGSCLLLMLLLQTPSTQQAGPPPAVQQPAPTPPAPEQPWPPIGVTRLGAGITAPRVIKEWKPRYTTEAMRARVQGSVVMEAVVQADGKVGGVRVVRSLDRKHGLDDEAVKALKSWEFAPGTKGGVALPVLVEVEMTFRVDAKG